MTSVTVKKNKKKTPFKTRTNNSRCCHDLTFSRNSVQWRFDDSDSVSAEGSAASEAARTQASSLQTLLSGEMFCGGLREVLVF